MLTVIKQHLYGAVLLCVLYYYTDQAAAAVVHYSLQCLLQLHLRVFRHVADLAVYALLHQLMQRLAEDIGIPYFLRVILKFAQYIFNQLFALALRTD